MPVRSILVLILSSLVAGLLQQPAPPRFRVAVDAVSVDALVTRGGRPVSGLSANDFEVRDNGVPQQVKVVSVEAVPVNVVLALDVSESVAGERLASLADAGRAAVRGLRAIDRAAILTFSVENRGWHDISVRVKGSSLDVRARRGYWR